jgi:transcription antitermination factor NusG
MHDPNPGLDRRWYVLTVCPQHELSVKRQLENKELEVSVPVYLVRRRWSDRIKTITLPLFAGYVFCRFAMDDRVRVLNTIGVRGVVTFACQFAALDDREMERIHRLAASGLNLQPLAGLKCGMAVRIIIGPLSGVEGVLAQVSGADRVVVNVALLNRSVAVQVEREALAAVNEMAFAIHA